MVKAFQVGKRYRKKDWNEHSEWFQEGFLCVYLSTEYAVVEDLLKSSAPCVNKKDWGLWEIVPPKPRTGKIVVGVHPDGNRAVWHNQTITHSLRVAYPNMSFFEADYTECTNDQDKTG